MECSRFRITLALYLLCFCFGAEAQTLAASNVLTNARIAFNPGSDIHSIHLLGTATFIRGSVLESGALDFTLASSGEGDLKISLPSGNWTEHWDPIAPGRTCDRVDSTGAHSMSAAECSLAIHWIFPQISLQPATRPEQVTLTADAAASPAGTSGPQLIALSSASGESQRSRAFFARWSKVSLTLDPDSARIAQMTFAVTPDDGMEVPINVMVFYSDYHTIGGITVPQKIERRLNGNTDLSLSISTVQVN